MKKMIKYVFTTVLRTGILVSPSCPIENFYIIWKKNAKRKLEVNFQNCLTFSSIEIDGDFFFGNQTLFNYVVQEGLKLRYFLFYIYNFDNYWKI